MTTGSRHSASGELWPEPPAKTDGAITAWCDGGSRGNPGPAGFGVHIEDGQGKTVAQLSEYIGRKTNNFAEYSGLLAALNYALEQGYSRLKVISDSELMVKQIKGQYRVQSPELRPLYEEAKRRIGRLDSFQIHHVLREKNRHGDRLANEAMDRGTGRTPSASGTPAPARDLRGFVKGGVVHFLEGELPDGVFVRITPERR
ncbi:MAG: ribonuclease HI family protein [Silvibacterium sp.]|nr:ribonuclease HI family protein [Silvibacterium sp.]MBV8436402.1 ribonuclease HI family protein [Silvibacterium sp.]